jgi:hypothetical protein
MRGILWLWRKIRSTARRGIDETPPRASPSRDPELVAIAEIAQQRRLDTERSLEAAFEKARLVLERETASARPVQTSELPADLEARVRAMPDPEQRIRAIVEFKLSTRTQSGHHDQTI